MALFAFEKSLIFSFYSAIFKQLLAFGFFVISMSAFA
jgi:hypothetical protein